MILLTISSVLTGLVTEAIKKMLGDKANKLPTNVLAAIISVLMAGIVCAGYMILNHIVFTMEVLVYIVSIIGLSWLCARLGFDKIKQTLNQLINL